MIIAVDFLVREIRLVGEVGLQREMLPTDTTLETLPVKYDFVHGADLLHLVDPLGASSALL